MGRLGWEVQHKLPLTKWEVLTAIYSKAESTFLKRLAMARMELPQEAWELRAASGMHQCTSFR